MTNFVLAVLLALAAILSGVAVPASAAEPDRIIQRLTVAGVAPGDQTVYVAPGFIDVVMDTDLSCTPPIPPARAVAGTVKEPLYIPVGCGVIVTAVLHAPIADPDNPDSYPLYPDVLDVVSSVPCGDTYAPGCQAPAGKSQFTVTFPVPRPGVYVLETWTIVGMDYPSPDVRLTTDFPATHEGAVYPQGVIYTVKGFVAIVVEDEKAA